MVRDLSERLYSKSIQLENGCIEWQGYRMPFGHGQILLQGKKVTTAHRAAWIAKYGEIPDGLIVRHKCDNPPCINVDHLELGTHKDNMQDAVKRNRNAKGFMLPHTKLSDEQVKEIRERYKVFTIPGVRGRRSNKSELALEYGVSEGHIKEIIGKRERVNV